MPRKKIKFNKFEVPESFLDKLFELTGSFDKMKGYVVAYIDENGNPQINERFDSRATEFAIKRFLEIYLDDNYHTIRDDSDQHEISDEED